MGIGEWGMGEQEVDPGADRGTRGLQPAYVILSDALLRA
jgi:hypothetical protein